jgi:hypothetical protein
VHKTLGPARNSRGALISEFGLEMELEQANDRKHLGMKVLVLRIGCLGKNNNYASFDVKQQAKRFFCSHDGFDAGWKPIKLMISSVIQPLL